MSNESEKGYLYFPGCSLKSTGRAYEESLLELFRLLDIPLQELDDWNCCGATSYMGIDEEAAFVLGARNLSIACQTPGRDLMAPCSACYMVLRKTQDYTSKYPQVRREVEAAMKRADLPMPGQVKIRHPLEILYHDVGAERLKNLKKRNWLGGTIACYYGCQAVRPYSDVDDAYNPVKMDELLRAMGVQTIDYCLKTKCCAGVLTGTVPPVGRRVNYILLKEAVRKGAQAVVTICPLCQINLDAYQKEISAESGERFDIPILYLPQVLGWMLGGRKKELAFHRCIAGRRYLNEWLRETKEEEAYV
ncbi:MAG: CoB--CoM heterodisulfide reductase iron-sulfur subunit B family protein [Verrucomicrobiae bacterium]|nr:CoB--CoM heterodisulfide reductase iron-sulfur subunit B family protein [Verrucomicrobiae bacterium]